MTDLETTIRLVRKLLAKAHGAGTTPEESAAFAAKANQLLLEHKLGLSDVQLREEDAEEPLGKLHVHSHKLPYKRWQEWINDLADTVATVHFCRLLICRPYSAVSFVGKTSDRELAAFLFETLANTAYRQGKEWANKVAREHQRRGERVPYRMLAGYLDGFATSVSTRLWQNYFATAKAGGQHAVTVFDAQRKRVNQFYDDLDVPEADYEDNSKGAAWMAVEAGAAAGKRVPLHGGLQPPATTGRPTIQAARNQLKGGT